MVWALVGASALAWGLKIFVKPQPAPPQTRIALAAQPSRGDLTRLLGAESAPEAVDETPAPVADARFQLIGVVSPRERRAAREGLALIAIDGKPPRAYRVGAVVEGQTVLQSVDARGATLGPRDGAAALALNLPPPAAAATGVPPGTAAAANAYVPPAPFAPPNTPGTATARPTFRPTPPPAVLPQIQPLPPTRGPQQRQLPGLPNNSADSSDAVSLR